ncbi:MAG: transposase IS605 [Mycoplasmataceae bacterium RC_NB112A]|nr:MAG: transposase IS605 [Mycoplasmataceae bacterium RC_NB112A]
MAKKRKRKPCLKLSNIGSIPTKSKEKEKGKKEGLVKTLPEPFKKGSLTCFEQINSLPTKKENNPFLKEVYSQFLQDVARRVNKSFQNFFRRLKAQASKAGYPRFKQYGRYESFAYPQSGFKIKKREIEIKSEEIQLL